MNLGDGRFVVPTRYRGDPYARKFVRLFARVADRLGAAVVYADDVREGDLPAGCPFVLLLKPVQWGRSDGFRGALTLPRRIRLFGYWDDVHQGPRGTRLLSRDRRVLVHFFRRCDAILCTYRAPFVSWYPRYADKLVHLPHFFGWDDFEGITFNPDPLSQCVLSGAIGRFYPLRAVAAQHPDVMRLPHPGYGAVSDADVHKRFGVEYARTLARYRCGVTCSATIGYTVAKYAELPAAGCLLLASDAPDLAAFGLRHGVNFLRVDAQDFGSTLAEVLSRPERFEGIRRAGFDLARSRHADTHRADQLEQFLRARCAEEPQR